MSYKADPLSDPYSGQGANSQPGLTGPEWDERRKPCPGCAEPCNQCDQEALD